MTSLKKIDWSKVFKGIDVTLLSINALDEALASGLLASASSILPQFKLVKKLELNSTFPAPGAKKVQVWYGPIKLLTADEVGKKYLLE
jgi:hypothetical protein